MTPSEKKKRLQCPRVIFKQPWHTWRHYRHSGFKPFRPTSHQGSGDERHRGRSLCWYKLPCCIFPLFHVIKLSMSIEGSGGEGKKKKQPANSPKWNMRFLKKIKSPSLSTGHLHYRKSFASTSTVIRRRGSSATDELLAAGEPADKSDEAAVCGATASDVYMQICLIEAHWKRRRSRCTVAPTVFQTPPASLFRRWQISISVVT